MTWGNPPKLVPTQPKKGKKITPEMLAGDSEHSQQVALFAWAADNVGKYPELALMFAVPNGGLRDIRTAVSLKAEGVKAGVPDIFLPACRYSKAKYGLFIEMKIKTNKATKEQMEWMTALTKASYQCVICYSWEEARDKIVAYLENRL